MAEAIDFCDYYAQEAVADARQHAGRATCPARSNEYLYEPRGVAVVIAPWNFPLAILCGMTAAAVATGNTAIMKPAEQSSVVGAKLMEVLASKPGCRAGVVNFLPGEGRGHRPGADREPPRTWP